MAFSPCLRKSRKSAQMTSSLSLLREPRSRPVGFPSVARRCWSPFSAPRRAVAFAHTDDLNRKRNAADKTAGANQGGTAMLAEIFMLRLEAAARAAKEAANSSRFVPITLPTAKAS